VVQLSGFVNTLAEKEQAGRVAATIKGVTEVKNNITIK
jgi:osmotically-inducible protein OsmY